MAGVAAAGGWGQIRAGLTYTAKNTSVSAAEPDLGCRRAGRQIGSGYRDSEAQKGSSEATANFNLKLSPRPWCSHRLLIANALATQRQPW